VSARAFNFLFSHLVINSCFYGVFMYLTQLVHFDSEGWCLLASTQDEVDQLSKYEWLTLAQHDGLPRVFTTASINGKKAETACQLRFEEIDNEVEYQQGDKVYFMLKNTEPKKRGVTRSRYKVHFGTITSINHLTGNLVIDHNVTLKLASALKFKHNMEKLAGTDAYVCDRCRALHTPLRLAN